MRKFDPAPKLRVTRNDYLSGIRSLLVFLAFAAIVFAIARVIWLHIGWLGLGAITFGLVAIGWIREHGDELALAVSWVVLIGLVIAAIIGVGYLLGIGISLAG